MKGKTKKTIALLMTFIMIFSMGLTALAEGGTEIDLSSDKKEGEPELTVSNAVYGSNLQKYEIKYLIEGTDDEVPGLEMVTGEAEIGTIINIDFKEEKAAEEGYEVVSGQNAKLTISEDEEENKISIYYEENEVEEETNFDDKSILSKLTLHAQWLETKPEIIEVEVPAIWYPVDKDTNEVIPGLNPIPTDPKMYDRLEAAKLNDDGIYMIDYMGVPYPKSSGSWSANNFMYTSNLMFTDRFHRVVAQGYGTYELDELPWQPGSSVRKLKYGDFEDIAPFDDAQEKYKGLLGFDQTPYQENVTMQLYIAARTDDANVSHPEFESNEVEVLLNKSDEEIREQLINNIKKVTYIDFDSFRLTPPYLDYDAELSLDEIDKMFIYKYSEEDDSNGEFFKEESGNYKNFMAESITALPIGRYEVVFPIYWERNIDEFLSAPDVFSRNRYKYSDTFHFTMILKPGLPEIIEVEVPAIWYPVDKDTNEVIPGLNPIQTDPKMYDRSEAAKLNDKGIYMIDYMGVPYPESPGSWSANNFMYTSNLMFTDRFHRVVAQGYGTYELDELPWQPGSSVRKLKYGDFEDVAPFDDAQEKYKGLLGFDQTPYQENVTMQLYIAARTDDANVSHPEFESNEVEVLLNKSDEEIREQLINNIKKVTYIDFDSFRLTPPYLDYDAELSLDEIDKMFIYKYSEEDDSNGEFFKEESGNYKNFMAESITALPIGRYEVVFPIYWERNIDEFLSAPDVFSRNRYTYSDTFHFTMELKEATYTVTFKDYDGRVLKEQIVEHGKDATAPSNPSRIDYTFNGWDKSYTNVTNNLVVNALYTKNSTGGGGSSGGGPSKPKDPPVVVVPVEPIPEDVPQLNKRDHIQYIQGYPDGTVKPEGNITRDEVAAVFFRLLDEEYRNRIRTVSHNFSDVASTRWSNKHIATLAKGGIITGYPDGTFKPGNYITRAELATIASRFDKLSPFVSDKFSDIAGHWANKYINSAAEKGWVKGYVDGTFKPDQYITRAEFVTLVNNVLERRVTRSEILPESRKFPDLPEDKWFYEAMMEAVNSHLYERLDNGYEHWTEIYYPEIEM